MNTTAVNQSNRPASETSMVINGPRRAPLQMLADQSYDGHKSVHDDETAAKLGLPGAPIEGPTHFSQFDPMLASLWGERWFTRGVLSSHFLNMVVEGEEVDARVTIESPDATTALLEAFKADGSPVLTASASVDGDLDATALAPRLEKAHTADPGDLHIIDQLSIGQKGTTSEVVNIGFDDHLGDLYPFTLGDKLGRITENLSWYTGDDNPWGRPVIPFEMLSVITGAGSKNAGFRVRQPSVGLFIDLEIRMLAGPVFVGQDYRLDREIVGLGQSRRTESYWTLTTLTDPESEQAVAQVLLHSGVFKDSYADYPTTS